MVAVTTAGRLDMHKSLPNFRELLLNPRGDMVGVLCFEMVYELFVHSEETDLLQVFVIEPGAIMCHDKLGARVDTFTK